MGKDVDDLQAHERRQPDRRPHVVGEDQEGAAVGDEHPRQRQAIENRAHGVLADAESEIPSTGSGRRLVGLALEVGVVGRGQVGGASRELRQDVPESGQDGAGGLAGGQGAVVGGEGRQVPLPAFRELAREGGVQLLGGRRMLPPIAIHQAVPLGLEVLARLRHLRERFAGLVGDVEGLLRPAERLPGELDLFRPERRAMRRGRVTHDHLCPAGVLDNDRRRPRSGFVPGGPPARLSRPFVQGHQERRALVIPVDDERVAEESRGAALPVTVLGLHVAEIGLPEQVAVQVESVEPVGAEEGVQALAIGDG